MPPTLFVLALSIFTFIPVLSTSSAINGRLAASPSNTRRMSLASLSDGSKGLPGNTSFLAASDLGFRNISFTSPISASSPLSMIATLLQIFSTTDISWVMITTVSFLVRLISFNRSRISAVIFGSRALVASSQRSTFGSDARALAIATRCRWPPESLEGYSFFLSSSPTTLSISRAFSFLFSFGNPLIFSGCMTLERTFLW